MNFTYLCYFYLNSFYQQNIHSKDHFLFMI